MATEPALETAAHAGASGPLLEVAGLTLRHIVDDRLLVQDAFLTLDSGEVLGIVGESGSGKSPLLFAIIRLLSREVEQVSGRITYRGGDVLSKSRSEMEEIRGLEMAMIVPGGKFSLNPVESVGHQIVDVLRSHFPDMKKRELHAQAIDILKIMGLPDAEIRFHAYPHEMSGGMAQRILIAKAMACSPRLLLGDEFTVGLDVTIQAEIMDHVHALVRERNTSLIITSSDLGLVAAYCDTVAIIKGGTILEFAPVLSFFADPQHSYSRLLLSAAREARAQQHVVDTHIETPSEQLAAPPFVHESLPAPSPPYRPVGPGHWVREET